MKTEFTHKQLVTIAYKWVLNNASCGVAFKELVTTSSEIADVIGFSSGGRSVLVEVKVSRADFLCDKKKLFRIKPEYGMGSERFYCCPTGLIKKEELPWGWGLIYVNEKMKATCVYNCHIPYTEIIRGKPYPRTQRVINEKNLKSEIAVMYSALRRLQIRGRIEEIYSQEFNGKINEQILSNQLNLSLNEKSKN